MTQLLSNNFLSQIRLPLLLKLLTTALGFLVNWYFAQKLSTDDFGLFALFQLLILFIVAISKCGLDQAAVRFIASQQQADIARFLPRVYAVFFTCISITVVTTGLFCHFYSLLSISGISTFQFWTLLHIASFATAIINLNACIFKGLSKPSLFTTFSGFASLCILLFGATIMHLSTLTLVLYLVTSALCITAITSLFIVIKLRPPSTTTPQPRYSFWISAKAFWISGLVYLVVQQGSQLYLSTQVSLSQLGVYAIVTKLAMLPSIFLFALNSVTAAKFAKSYSQHRLDVVKQLFSLSQSTSIFVAAITVLLFYFYSEYLLGIFGEDYKQGELWLLVLIAGQVINLITGPAITLLTMSGQEKTYQNISIFTAAITVILAMHLITNHGPLGAAITTAIAMSTQNLLGYYFARYKILRNH
ncbi:hypothetical protein EXT47_14360 [Pseudoalteromonas sp. CO342X]|nr:hypothetical protein EXT47_14360 [Pseudoalteromonas sp. CO342X]